MIYLRSFIFKKNILRNNGEFPEGAVVSVIDKWGLVLVNVNLSLLTSCLILETHYHSHAVGCGVVC